mmetsp:Transcript_13654/g.54063  ORF Transcript_13654/g.54063 Transcript_13654/m.54063 type:complete len:359 (+) Transcript_13654:386-1462(+)
MAARAALVGDRTSGMASTTLMLVAIGSCITRIGPRCSVLKPSTAVVPGCTEGPPAVMPPTRAGHTLSAWPSFSLHSVTSWAVVKPRSHSWLAMSAPATVPAALEPRPRQKGISLRMRSTRAGGRLRPCFPAIAVAVRHTRLCAGSVTVSSSRPSPSNCICTPWAPGGGGSTCTSRNRPTAMPSASKPGPRFAQDAGTRTQNASTSPSPPPSPPRSSCRSASREAAAVHRFPFFQRGLSRPAGSGTARPSALRETVGNLPACAVAMATKRSPIAASRWRRAAATPTAEWGQRKQPAMLCSFIVSRVSASDTEYDRKGALSLRWSASGRRITPLAAKPSISAVSCAAAATSSAPSARMEW